MRSSSTFSVLFWVYAPRADKNNCSTIYDRVTANGKRVSISLKHKVCLDSWDIQRQKARNNGKKSRKINLYLDEVKSEIVRGYRDLKAESRILTPQLIKTRFFGEDKKIHSLQDIFEFDKT